MHALIMSSNVFASMSPVFIRSMSAPFSKDSLLIPQALVYLWKPEKATECIRHAWSAWRRVQKTLRHAWHLKECMIMHVNLLLTSNPLTSKRAPFFFAVFCGFLRPFRVFLRPFRAKALATKRLEMDNYMLGETNLLYSCTKFMSLVVSSSNSLRKFCIEWTQESGMVVFLCMYKYSKTDVTSASTQTSLRGRESNNSLSDSFTFASHLVLQSRSIS